MSAWFVGDDARRSARRRHGRGSRSSRSAFRSISTGKRKRSESRIETIETAECRIDNAAAERGGRGRRRGRGAPGAAARWRADRRPDAILRRGLVAAMDEAGRLFEAGEFFVPELLVAARAMKAAMAVLDPLLAGTASRARPAASRSARCRATCTTSGRTWSRRCSAAAGSTWWTSGRTSRPSGSSRPRGTAPTLIGALGLADDHDALHEGGALRRSTRPACGRSPQVMVGGAPVTPAVCPEHRRRRVRRQRGRRRDPGAPAAGPVGGGLPMTEPRTRAAAMRRRQPDRPPFDFSWGFSEPLLDHFRERTGADNPDDYFGADTQDGANLAHPAADRLLALPRNCRPAPGVDEWGIGRRPTREPRATITRTSRASSTRCSGCRPTPGRAGLPAAGHRRRLPVRSASLPESGTIQASGPRGAWRSSTARCSKSPGTCAAWSGC